MGEDEPTWPDGTEPADGATPPGPLDDAPPPPPPPTAATPGPTAAGAPQDAPPPPPPPAALRDTPPPPTLGPFPAAGPTPPAAPAGAARGARVLVVASVGMLLAAGAATFALGRTPATERPAGPVTLSLRAAAEAFTAAGCTTLAVDVLEDRSHLDPGSAPPADELYTAGRPTASGPHYAAPAPLLDGVAREPLDERAVTHNMEHGSVVVWLRPDVEDEVVDDVGAWVRDRNAGGFAVPAAAAGVFASPVPADLLPEGTDVALRAWGVAVDCGAWDSTVADAFLHDNFGSHGTAPEARLGPFPEAAIDLVE